MAWNCCVCACVCRDEGARARVRFTHGDIWALAFEANKTREHIRRSSNTERERESEREREIRNEKD